MPQPPGQDFKGAGRFAIGHKIRAALKQQGYTGVGFFKLLVCDFAWPGCRIIEINAVFAKAFQHQEVVKVPKQNRWKFLFLKRVNFQPYASGGQPVGAGSFDYAAGFAAIPGDTAGNPQSFQWHPFFKKAQHNSQRGGSAFHRFHLNQGGRTNPAHKPTVCLSMGITRLMGLCTSTVKEAAASVPLLSSRSLAAADDQR